MGASKVENTRLIRSAPIRRIYIWGALFQEVTRRLICFEQDIRPSVI